MTAESPTRTLPGLHALVVDDSESARQILKRILEAEGIEVLTADDGESAIEALRANPDAFDLVLIDLVMETIDGIETIRQLRKILAGRSVPLIPMSATFSPAIEASCHEAGAYPAMLRKPFRAVQVHSLLLEALSAHAGEGRLVQQGGQRVDAASQMVDLSLPGCDLNGALERCGGDLGLLRRLMIEFRTVATTELEGASIALRRGDPVTADRSLHKLRGELLNLGFVELVSDLMALQAELAPATKQSTGAAGAQSAGLVDANPFEPLLRKISTLRDRLFVLLERIQRLNAFTDQASGMATQAQPKVDSEDVKAKNFARLTSLLAADDPAALQLIPARGPLLPDSYDESVQSQFRYFLEALDFPAALSLLRPQDVTPVAEDEEGEGFRILIADDAAVTVRLLTRLLEGMGSLRIALDGVRALQIVKKWHPDLVISDVDMGNSSGIDLCRTIKSDPELAVASVMLISASDDVAVEVEGLTAGAVDFLEKPLNPARVVGRVAAQLSAIRRKAESSALVGELDHESKTGFLTSDLSGQVSDISPPLARWLGQKSRPQRGLFLHDLFEPAFFPVIDDAIRKHRRAGRIGPLETVMVSTDGARLPVRVIGRDMPGQKTRVLWFGVEDISARIIQERSRSEAQLSQKMGVLASGIAHEFNNLLGVVIGRIDLALEMNSNPRIATHLQHANEAALRAATISRSLRGSAEQTISSRNSAQRLSDALDHCWPMIRNLVRPAVILKREVQDPAVAVRVGSDDLRTALMRLVENAAEATPDGGTIRLIVSRQRSNTNGAADKAVIEVTDTGAGMVSETRALAFDAFFTTKGPNHTGLGLSEVMNIMIKNAGTASIHSEAGKGTTVRLEFPVASNDGG